jgi:hypothetical protein
MHQQNPEVCFSGLCSTPSKIEPEGTSKQCCIESCCIGHQVESRRKRRKTDEDVFRAPLPRSLRCRNTPGRKRQTRKQHCHKKNLDLAERRKSRRNLWVRCFTTAAISTDASIKPFATNPWPENWRTFPEWKSSSMRTASAITSIPGMRSGKDSTTALSKGPLASRSATQGRPGNFLVP